MTYKPRIELLRETTRGPGRRTGQRTWAFGPLDEHNWALFRNETPVRFFPTAEIAFLELLDWLTLKRIIGAGSQAETPLKGQIDTFLDALKLARAALLAAASELQTPGETLKNLGPAEKTTLDVGPGRDFSPPPYIGIPGRPDGTHD